MVKCACENKLEDVKTFILDQDKEIESIADEEERKIASLKTKILIDLDKKMSDWSYCNCYAAQPLRKVKQILEYNIPLYKSDTIPINELHYQYSVIKQTLRGTS